MDYWTRDEKKSGHWGHTKEGERINRKRRGHAKKKESMFHYSKFHFDRYHWVEAEVKRKEKATLTLTLFVYKYTPLQLVLENICVHF